ncbi:MAG: hypothetical protein IJX76_07105 [Clostridia bacterium]|nr:hypothetical protein [Clostridia bacterium]
MFDDKNHDRNDALGQRLQKIGGQMNPSPQLKKAAKTGVPLRPAGLRYTAGTHVRKFTKAVLTYAACIVLFLGAILLIPRWFGGNEPTPGGSVDPIVTSKPADDPGSSGQCNHKYVMLTMGLRPSCTEGEIRAYRCQYCGHSYSEQDPAPGHNFVDGVCTRCGEAEVQAECEHLLPVGSCPYCKCDEHEFVTTSTEVINPCIQDNVEVFTCTKCGLSYTATVSAPGHFYENGVCTVCDHVCRHEYSDIFHNGICTVCGMECEHDYVGDACDVVCTRCGKRLGHDYDTITSIEQICTEGTLTTTACKRCGYGYTETTPAKGHSYKDGVCTVCGEAKKVISVTDPNVTAGSVSLLPEQMYQTYPNLSGDDFYRMDSTTTPVFYNVYTYFEGCTITDIRLPVYRAEEGSVFTVRVMRTNNGINAEEIATYKLTADRALSREWVLFSDLSIEVPEGCTLVFGWMSDTLELAQPMSGYIPGYSYCNDYRGSCGTVPLIMDIYGKRN